MTFLALDTGGDYAVLVLAADDGSVRAARTFEGRRTLSRRLIGELDRLLADNGESLQTLSAIAVGIGPGSFTGVRVGVTTAKTLAQVTGKPLIAVGTLDAYAHAITPGPEESVVPVLPSRRGEVYAAIYGNGTCSERPFAIPIEALADRLAGLTPVILCGRTDYLPSETANAPATTRLRQPWTPPEGLADIAALRLTAGEYSDPLSLVPLYAAQPLISTPKDQRVLGVGGIHP